MLTADDVQQLVEQAKACLKPGSEARVGARDDDDVMHAFLNDIVETLSADPEQNMEGIHYRVLRETLQAKWYAESAFKNQHPCLEILRTLQRKAAQELAQ